MGKCCLWDGSYVSVIWSIARRLIAQITEWIRVGLLLSSVRLQSCWSEWGQVEVLSGMSINNYTWKCLSCYTVEAGSVCVCKSKTQDNLIQCELRAGHCSLKFLALYFPKLSASSNEISTERSQFQCIVSQYEGTGHIHQVFPQLLQKQRISSTVCYICTGLLKMTAYKEEHSDAERSLEVTDN